MRCSPLKRALCLHSLEGTLKNIDYPSSIAFIALVNTCFSAGFFTGSSSWGSALSGIVASIISSYVFFFITVTLKEREERKKNNRIIYPQLENLVRKMDYALEVCLPEAVKNQDNKSIDISRLEKSFQRRGALNEKIDKGQCIVKYPKNKYEAVTYRELLAIYTTFPIFDLLEQLKPHYYLMEKDLVQVISKLASSHYLRITGATLVDENRVFFIPPYFIEFAKGIEDLRVQLTRMKM